MLGLYVQLRKNDTSDSTRGLYIGWLQMFAAKVANLIEGAVVACPFIAAS
jgi:hypothetical protein